MEYRSEEEFLKNYNSDRFEKLSMTADILLVSVSDQESSNYRKTSKKMMSILLVKRNDYPYKDQWCLPGGFLDVKSETLEECARRVLKNETNLSNIYLEQLYTFDGLDRDPRMRVVSTSYIALVDKNRLDEKINKNASWFDVVLYEEKGNIVEITLDNGEESLSLKISKKLRDKTTDRYSTYKLDFIRTTGEKTKPGSIEINTTNCPNCGAPTQITSSGKCEYCGSVITTGEHSWALSNLEKIG